MQTDRCHQQGRRSADLHAGTVWGGGRFVRDCACVDRGDEEEVGEVGQVDR